MWLKVRRATRLQMSPDQRGPQYREASMQLIVVVSGVVTTQDADRIPEIVKVTVVGNKVVMAAKVRVKVMRTVVKIKERHVAHILTVVITVVTEGVPLVIDQVMRTVERVVK